MKDFEDLQEALKDLFDSMMSVDSGGSNILGRYLELERSLLGRYRDLMTDRMSDRSLNDAMQGFTKLMMAGFMETIAFQRDAQKKMFGAQARFADSYMSFLDKMVETLDKSESESSRKSKSKASSSSKSASAQSKTGK